MRRLVRAQSIRRTPAIAPAFATCLFHAQQAVHPVMGRHTTDQFGEVWERMCEPWIWEADKSRNVALRLQVTCVNSIDTVRDRFVLASQANKTRRKKRSVEWTIRKATQALRGEVYKE